MPSVSPQDIRKVARQCGYVERRGEISSTLFFKKLHDDNDGTLVNVFYTTRGVMTKLNHPTKGQNELWRSCAYDSVQTLEAIFRNPRLHTGKGYRTTDQSVRGCIECGWLKKRDDFSKNQWRKGPDENVCKDCVEKRHLKQQQENKKSAEQTNGSNEIDRSCIQCDADECGKSAPAIRCSRCLLAYYCSEKCQRRHQQAHGPDCIPIEQMRERFAESKEPDASTMKGAALAAQLAGRHDMESLLRQAEYIYQDEGKWDSAAELYKSLLMDEAKYFAGSAPQQRRVWMGLCRCFFEMGDYDKAIRNGSIGHESPLSTGSQVHCSCAES